MRAIDEHRGWWRALAPLAAVVLVAVVVAVSGAGVAAGRRSRHARQRRDDEIRDSRRFCPCTVAASDAGAVGDLIDVRSRGRAVCTEASCGWARARRRERDGGVRAWWDQRLGRRSAAVARAAGDRPAWAPPAAGPRRAAGALSSRRVRAWRRGVRVVRSRTARARAGIPARAPPRGPLGCGDARARRRRARVRGCAARAWSS